ncbi:hypothetical protein ACUSIJ_20010 [Pseudochelatococcus sp. B33]
MLPVLSTPGGRYEPDEQLTMVYQAIENLADPWSRTQRIFLRGYFDLIRSQIQQNTPEIERLLRPHGPAFRPEDRIFSALLPLPQAYLESGKTRVRADFAFITGDSVIAVIVSAHELPDRLGPPHSTIFVRPDQLESASICYLRSRLPETIANFWREESIPLAPYGTRLPEDAGSIVDVAKG